MISFKVFTLFKELFPGVLGSSIIGSALKKKLWNLQAIDIRDYADNPHKTVDDMVYGGGSGMLLKADVVGRAIEENTCLKKTKIIYLSPRGKVFNQKMACDLARESEIAIICGRYEGLDQRVLDEFEIEEISLGDYILSNGEIASYVFIDAILRNVKGVLGDEKSIDEESFCMKESEFLLEYPNYTRPKIWKNREVPEVLTSGHHKNIEDWRLKKCVEITKSNRYDLYEKYLRTSSSITNHKKMKNIIPYKGILPKIAPSSFIAHNAIISGDVEIGQNSGIWYGCTIRGDVSHIRIGKNTNIQDNSVIHVTRPNHVANKTGDDGAPTLIGDNVTIGHNAVIHACIIADNSFIGMGAIVMDLAKVEEFAMLAAGAVLTPGKIVKTGELWVGNPAKYFRDLTQEEKDYIKVSADNYAKLALEYKNTKV